MATYPTNSVNAGKVVVGGDFTSFGGFARGRIARLNADGSVDTTFDPGTGADGLVRSVTIQLDGKVLLGGAFTNVNGVALTRIARLNNDGSVDATFTPGLGANDSVYAVTLQPDQRILLGGEFSQCSGVTRSRISWAWMRWATACCS